jgi:hypothetical protein
METIQARFEVAVTELPDHIDPASYSACSLCMHALSLCANPRVFFTVTS